MSFTPLEMARVAALAADEKKAEDILVLDLSESSDVCDCFLIMTVSNKRLADAVITEIEDRVRVNCLAKPIGVEGRAEGNWILLDYGPLVIHAFTPEARDYYRLERLWGDAPRLSFGLESELSSDSADVQEASELEADKS